MKKRQRCIWFTKPKCVRLKQQYLLRPLQNNNENVEKNPIDHVRCPSVQSTEPELCSDASNSPRQIQPSILSGFLSHFCKPCCVKRQNQEGGRLQVPIYYKRPRERLREELMKKRQRCIWFADPKHVHLKQQYLLHPLQNNNENVEKNPTDHVRCSSVQCTEPELCSDVSNSPRQIQPSILSGFFSHFCKPCCVKRRNREGRRLEVPIYYKRPRERIRYQNYHRRNEGIRQENTGSSTVEKVLVYMCEFKQLQRQIEKEILNSLLNHPTALLHARQWFGARMAMIRHNWDRLNCETDIDLLQTNDFFICTYEVSIWQTLSTVVRTLIQEWWHKANIVTEELIVLRQKMQGEDSGVLFLTGQVLQCCTTSKITEVF